MDVSDLHIYNSLVKGRREKQSGLHDRVEVLLRGSQQLGLQSRAACLAYLGRNFRVVLSITNPEVDDAAVGAIFLRENICVHLEQNTDKFNFLCLMVDKLYALVNEEV